MPTKVLKPSSLMRFLKNYMLPIAIVGGAVAYLTESHLTVLSPLRPYMPGVVSVVQPLLIFSMLFVTFCKVDVCRMRPRLWHVWLLLIQGLVFVGLSLLLWCFPQTPARMVMESAMLCFICPTATAATVVTGKLHGDSEAVIAHTVGINLLVSVLVPLMVPLAHPQAGMTFLRAFLLILHHVFPMLICPLLLAQAVRFLWPRLQQRITACRDLAFYLWAVSLSIAIAVSVRSLVHSHCAATLLLAIALSSLVACVFQFAAGRYIGRRYGTPIASCQALGQKNTVFAIWMGYTFLTPVSSLAGGFYSIWHNIFNAWQLDRQRHAEERA